jgi:hypothetical protein
MMALARDRSSFSIIVRHVLVVLRQLRQILVDARR